jgi:DNA-binding NtrC family response regulator
LQGPDLMSTLFRTEGPFFKTQLRDKANLSEAGLAKKVLVADDEFLIRWSLTEVLSERGYLVKAVESGDRALEAIRAERFDFIITDLIMPGRDGWEVLQYAKGTYPRTKVVVITAHGTQDTEAMAKERGAYGYIEKPEIIDKIMMLLEGTL